MTKIVSTIPIDISNSPDTFFYALIDLFESGEKTQIASNEIEFTDGEVVVAVTGKFTLDEGGDETPGSKISKITFEDLSPSETLVTMSKFSVTIGQLGKAMIGPDPATSFLNLFLGGKDTLFGSVEQDLLWGWKGNDLVRGNEGDDTIVGGFGTDTIDGGADFDTVSFFEHKAAVSLKLKEDGAQSRAKVGGALSDKIKNVEGVIGGKGNDKLTGNSDRNYLEGGDGKDTLAGGLDEDEFGFANATGKADVILDFESGADLILLNEAAFDPDDKVGEGGLFTDYFQIGAPDDADDYFFYLDNALWWDRDANGLVFAPFKIVVLKTTISADDIFVGDYF